MNKKSKKSFNILLLKSFFLIKVYLNLNDNFDFTFNLIFFFIIIKCFIFNFVTNIIISIIYFNLCLNYNFN